ncbi:hypothetical protein [Streptomyces sp. Iso 434]|uniref:hypothetical protein n=1 Tax=Streptomyces sp. Iso 434 TaxID=3062272 RepID=UPI00397F5CA0
MPQGGTATGPRLVFDTYDDIRGRVRHRAGPTDRQRAASPAATKAPSSPATAGCPSLPRRAERHQADDSTPDTIRIELVRRQLPPLDPDDLSGRLEAAARLAPPQRRWRTTLLGCAVSPGNWTTTTEDSATGRRIGLRVDKGRRRLCLSLGPRYLLIGDHNIQQICRTLHVDLDRHHACPVSVEGASISLIMASRLDLGGRYG